MTEWMLLDFSMILFPIQIWIQICFWTQKTIDDWNFYSENKLKNTFEIEEEEEEEEPEGSSILILNPTIKQERIN